MSKGKINVSVENIFPLIKKFLYSDHEIFLRELISNATDATLKLVLSEIFHDHYIKTFLISGKIFSTETLILPFDISIFILFIKIKSYTKQY